MSKLRFLFSPHTKLSKWVTMVSRPLIYQNHFWLLLDRASFTLHECRPYSMILETTILVGFWGMAKQKLKWRGTCCYQIMSKKYLCPRNQILRIQHDFKLITCTSCLWLDYINMIKIQRAYMDFTPFWWCIREGQSAMISETIRLEG